MDRRGDRDRPLYMISVAADLAGVHPQTLRIYERKCLVSPKRSAGNTRLYSQADVERLREIQRLTQEEGINLLDIEIDHQQLLMHTHLGSRQTDAPGGIHAAQHVAGKVAHRLIDAADAPCLGAQVLGPQGADRKRRLIHRFLGHHHRAVAALRRAGHLGEAAGQGIT